ncbi:MarR family transcriptional regulator [Blastococcus sp. KM273128]|uniref:MarR family winged helix-turn-helix transcriptional regulator n=1 Tax=Blastococcus sp. KM273128 TaxID=2570314 RepID=UPI001F01F2E5|nr:MarR family transcriptional regulator [Blastococcus sp. KM273128]MCF6744398.1 MarR family transcriptional regulator [Blastococcus sp. KM273128]
MPLTPATRDRLMAGVAQLIRAGRHLSSRAATQLHGDLPSFGWSLLVPLERDGDLRCSALAAHAGVDGSVASRQLATLERAGYVERHPDPRDGRAALFRLTGRGADALATSRALRSAWARTALADWDDDDARRLAGLLERLVADIDVTGAQPRPEPAGATR